MRLARCKDSQGNTVVGKVENGCLYPMEGSFFGEHGFSGSGIALEPLCFLPPVEPSKVLALGFNYRDHAEEFQKPIPKWPNVFMKPNSCLTGHGQPVFLPAKYAKRVDYEAELVVVIGKTARHVRREDALEYVLGYTCGNDVSARNLQAPDNQWAVCKGFDTFGPLGPWVETELDPGSLNIEMLVNGQVRQSTNSRHLIFDVPDLISYLSDVMTLEPGDVIFTGTTSGVGPVEAGDEMEVRIQGIGSLVNRVEREIL